MKRAAGARNRRPGRAAERRTIAALSESGEAGGTGPSDAERPPVTGDEPLTTAEESSLLMAELPDVAEEPALATPPAGRGVARNTAIFSIATGISRIVGLLREIVAASFFGTSGAGIGVHDRLPGPEPGAQPVRERRAFGGVRAGVHRTAAEGPEERGLPARLDAVLDHADRARRDHRLLHPRGRRDHAAVHRRHVQR